jgi:dihydroorotase
MAGLLAGEAEDAAGGSTGGVPEDPARAMNETPRLTLSRPLDMHLHLRDGDMLRLVAPASAAVFSGAVIMPNLVPPVTSVEALVRYRERIMAACGTAAAGFRPLMTLFFRDDYTAAELEAARPHLFAIKLYPHGVTTNSESGIHSIHAGTPVFRLMEEMGIPLLVHGETSGFVMDREREFLPVYEWLATTFPRLRIVMEHITTEAAVQLLDRYENLHATVTPHHLVITLDDVAGGLLQPHLFCKPIAKRPEDRDALLAAALAAHPKLMMGSDSAPHPRHAKECCGCAAGVWSAPVLLPRLAELFAAHGALANLQAFVSDHARRIHGLEVPERRVVLEPRPWTVPSQFAAPGGDPVVVPWEAGRELAWQVTSVEGP